jgi:glycosyltransferase involved in cell wall biosynthesis
VNYFVSIVMPAFNEEKYIEQSLNAVRMLDYPKDLLEIIVVDNGSTDDTVKIARKYADQVLVCPGIKVGAVRNMGVRHARGDIIAFIDSDCVPDAGWLKNSLEYMTANSCDAVGGIYLLRANPTWIERAWLINPQPRNGATNRLVGGSIIILKDVFWDCGMFEENLNAGEDYALARSLIKKGYTLHEAKSCALIHLGYPLTIPSFVARQFWHSSSYLKSRKKDSFDYLLFLVIIFLGSALLTIPLLLLTENAGFATLLVPILVPAILSVKRISAAGYKSYRIDNYLKIYALDFCYLVGRSAGLLRSIFTELKLISDKKMHY